MLLPIHYPSTHWAERKKVREVYVKIQDGLCYHCGTPLEEVPCSGIMAMGVDVSLFPPNFFKHPIHLHHNHETGMTIGAVHAQCNAILWQYHGE